MPNMTIQSMAVVRLMVLVLLCLQQSLSVIGLQVDGLQNAGFFDVQKSIPDIECNGEIGVTRLTSETNCAIPAAVGPDNAITNIDPDSDQGNGTYKIEPLNLTSYAIFCLETTVTKCFSAMTYELELGNSTDNELQCQMNFTAGDNEASSDKRPEAIVWRKNGEMLKGQSSQLTDADFKEISAELPGPSRVFSVTSTLQIDRSNNTSTGEYECIYSYKTQDLASDNPVQITGAPQVFITFKLQTDDKKPKEEQEENDDEEKQYTDGDNVTITCKATGYPRPTIQWLHEGKPLTSMELKERLTADYVISWFTIENLDDYIHRGNYTCIADNGLEGGNREKSRLLHARDRLAPLWPFIGIVVQVIVLAVVIAIGERFRKKKVAEKLRRTQLAEHQPGTSVGNKCSSDT